MAGGSVRNSKYYLYTGRVYWTSTSYSRDDKYVYETYGVRPVINLKAGSLKKGQGTWNDPYQVE